jgi:uncharacterized membrane protein
MNRAVWVVIVIASCAIARAQDTGGSFGGGDFGDSGGGDFGGGSDYGGGGSDYGGGSDTSYSGSSGDYSSSPGSSSGGSDWTGLIILIVLLSIIMGGVVLGQRAQNQKVRQPPRKQGRLDVTGLTIAIDWRAREQIQGRLEALAKEHSASTPAGRAKLLRETTTLLLRASDSWLYAAARCLTPMSPQQAEGVFREMAIAARSRFKHELVRRNEDALVHQTGPAMQARANEGEGVVVITLIVAARRELMDLRDPSDPGELTYALNEMQTFAGHGHIAAIEVVWSPAARDDRMSTSELETLYTELRPIRGAERFGKIVCAHCGGSYPAEIGRCPHCGASHKKA